MCFCWSVHSGEGGAPFNPSRLSFYSLQLYEHCRVSAHIWSTLLRCKGTVLLPCPLFSHTHTQQTFLVLVSPLWHFEIQLYFVFLFVSFTLSHNLFFNLSLVLCFRTSRGSRGGWVWAIRASFSTTTRTKSNPGRWDDVFPDVTALQAKRFPAQPLRSPLMNWAIWMITYDLNFLAVPPSS